MTCAQVVSPFPGVVSDTGIDGHLYIWWLGRTGNQRIDGVGGT